MKPLPIYVRVTRPLFEVFARLVFRVYCPLTVVGRENLPPLPFLFCSNHASHMDSIVLMTASRYRFSRFGLLAADDYFFRRPEIYRRFSCLVQLIPISRMPSATSLLRTIESCRLFLNGGARGLVLFPEGTRSTNGTLGEFKRGGGMLAVKLGIPVVPAYIDGTRDAMPKGRSFPASRRVTVRIGAPVYPNIHPAATPGETYDNIVLEARKRIEEMRGSVRGH
jgi:1-acyl-sn-glycerol-3-phosphate acyltransferase